MRALALFLACTSALAGEDDELDRIPQAETTAVVTPAASRRLDAKLFVEDALTLAAARDAAVPFPPPAMTRAQNRTSLDATLSLRPLAELALVASDRVDVVIADDASAANVLRELYASWEPLPRTYLEVGRINVRNGAALGFNPTDFFRPRTLVAQASLDPSALGRNRLGTLMVRAQALWSGGSASLLYAPELTALATNAEHRALATASFSVGDLSVQGLAFAQDGRSKLGLDLTFPIGQSVVAYGEWSGGPEKNLVARAIEYGERTGVLPAGAPPPIPTDGSLGFTNDVAAGASWTIGTQLTLNVEYHFHQAGFSSGDWDRWFDAGRRQPQLAGELWYIRGYAAAELEPVAAHQLFLRAAWPKAFLEHLEIDGLAFVSLVDGSTLSQLSLRLDLSDAWTATLTATGNLGPARSERGSFPLPISGVIGLVRYL